MDAGRWKGDRLGFGMEGKGSDKRRQNGFIQRIPSDRGFVYVPWIRRGNLIVHTGTCWLSVAGAREYGRMAYADPTLVGWWHDGDKA